MKIDRILKDKINRDLAKFCSKWRTSKEWRDLLGDLYDKYGMEFLITGYPHRAETGSKSWSVYFDIDGERVENALLVVSMYESSYDYSDKKEYNMYIS